MKQITIAFCILVLNAICYQAYAQLDQQAAEKAWKEYMTPGSLHQMLAKADGEWTADMTMWMDPTAQPTKSTSKSVNKMILGGRYQESKFTGDFMGMPFEGISVTGYDNAKKEFVSSWVDNMGTGIMFMKGKWDEKTKSIIYTGTGYDPATGKDCNIRQIHKWIDDNNQELEMYTDVSGKEFKSMELKLKKK